MKAKTPQPIDRPLSRAYLREFTGWSTAYPPGISDPTSLRVMENVMIQRDGSARIRPGLRYLITDPLSKDVVGSFEPFFLNDGSKAYLYAVVEDDDTVGFRVLADVDGLGLAEHGLTEEGVGFLVPQGETALAFSSDTTYVKYLQIDNKIFALSNAGEAMRYFEVGDAKLAKALGSISEPSWDTADKLTVVHPPQLWVNGQVAAINRTNLCVNPAFETGVSNWNVTQVQASISTVKYQSGVEARTGDRSMRINTTDDSATPTVSSHSFSVTGGLDYAFSAWMKAGSVAKDFIVRVAWYAAGDVFISSTTGSSANITSAGWTQVSVLDTAPATAVTATVIIQATSASATTSYYYIDDVLFEQAAAVGTNFDGDTADAAPVYYEWTSTPHGSTSVERELVDADSTPTAATPTVDTLISSTDTDNTYSYGFFYTFANEVGESAASQITVVKAQRGWSQLKWETPDANAAPSGTPTSDPTACADQLAAIIPEEVFDQAINEGAIKWNLYALTWSDQDPVPVTALKIATVDLSNGPVYESDGWAQLTPQQADISADIAALPTQDTRQNYSTPSRGGQGLVAADRMIMVYDPVDAAVIRWSSNQQGSYTDFSANKGGGYKTLTSGNLFVPAVVKLWQNPQSVDTLTILCLGTDGRSTGYYMAPSQVASQSEAVNIMGFEETTATPGTTSPYGCEVLNNALYHPLDELLMKSSATNYNINHMSLTDQIQNGWKSLADKHHIVSSQHDNRLYYLVHNPDGEALEGGCWGNEVWVYDAAQKAGSWSRWLVQGQSLRKLLVDGQAYMGLVRPDGIYYFDENAGTDDYVGMGPGNMLSANEASLETDVAHWSGVLGTTVAQSSTHAYDGTQALRVTWPAGVFTSARSTLSGLDIGQEYTISCYVWVPAGARAIKTNIVGIGSSDATTLNDQWVRVVKTFTATATSHNFDIIPSTAGVAGEQCWVDGIQLEEGDTATAFTTAASAIGLLERAIPWQLETNTQGANRAHDAWAHLQQANVILGNFQGTMQYGVRGRDVNGKPVSITKTVRDDGAAGDSPWDLEDYMLVRRDMKEWFFFAGSATDENGETLASSGQINLVQYRYTPVSVNTGYEYGSVETFEYGRSGNAASDRNTDNGIPMPYIDTGRP